jgi:8-hydroxy-5-deazaflavin:NADPH oxidoreductase
VRIGVLGSGRIGATAARLLAQAGHDVRIANSRGPEALRDLVAELGRRVEAATPAEAVRFGEVVLVAVPWRARESLREYGPYDGKVVVDATNPYGPDGVEDLGDDTSSEIVSRLVPGARLVKAFNTMHFSRLGGEGRPEAPEDERPAVFVAGDHAQAKEAVAGLVRELGFAPVDTGSLRAGGRRQQPGAPIYNMPLTGAEGRAAVVGALSSSRVRPRARGPSEIA